MPDGKGRKVKEERTNQLRFMNGQLQQRWSVTYRRQGEYGGHYGGMMERDHPTYEWRDVPSFDEAEDA